MGSIAGKKYLTHRVIWAMETGAWPTDQIDHINHDRIDNRFANLREASNLENGKNTSLRYDNTSGAVGVSWAEGRSRWLACICVNGRSINLGRFVDIEDAISARQAANITYGFHINHGTHP